MISAPLIVDEHLHPRRGPAHRRQHRQATRSCCGPNRAMPYSITLSARATNVGGTVTLSELNQVFGKAA